MRISDWSSDVCSSDLHIDDHILLDAAAPSLAGATGEDIADRWIFSGNRNLVREVVVGGDRVVIDGHHRDRDAVALRYRTALETLTSVGATPPTAFALRLTCGSTSPPHPPP